MTDRDPLNLELDMLRAFYASWRAFHAIPRDKLHRNKQQAAADTMVDNHHNLTNFYRMHPEVAPGEPERPPRLEVVRG